MQLKSASAQTAVLTNQTIHADNAKSKSAMRSSTDSSPIESLKVSSPAPLSSRCSGVNWRCVVDAGCKIKLLVSPMFACMVYNIDIM